MGQLPTGRQLPHTATRATEKRTYAHLTPPDRVFRPHDLRAKRRCVTRVMHRWPVLRNRHCARGHTQR